jgi:hypothetical protein
MRADCFAIGAGFALGGLLGLLSSLTRTGRNLDRAYLKMFPRRGLTRRLAPMRNPIAAIVGAILMIVGISILAKAIYYWWTGRPCDM